MPNGGLQRETFRKASVDVKLDLLYDLWSMIYEQVSRLEKRKKYDTIAATSGGVIGGFTAIIAKWFFWRQ